MSKPTLTVYGATSFTARELLRYLDTHPDGESFNLILSGRNGQKLETATRGMKRQKELVQCDLTDEDAVRDLVARSTAIVNLAGPFRNHHAEALIKECAATGTHYLDLCGERFFIGKVIIPKFDYQASTTGACIIPAAGFDSIPSDMTLYVALRKLQESHPKATITSARSFFNVSGALSGGSLATMKSEIDTPPEERERGEWVLTSMRGETAPPRFIYTSHHPSLPRTLIGGFFFMYPFNRCIVRRSWYLSRLSPQITGLPEKEPRHGDGLVYDEAFQTDSRVKAFLTTLGLTIFGLLVFGSRWIRDLVFLFLRDPGSGPSEEVLRSGGLRLTNIAQTTEPGISVVTTCKHDGDPGYISTNYMLAEAALSLLLPPPEGTSLPPLASKGGVLTPSTALGMVLVERLNRSGKVVWESKIWDERKPHRD